MHRLRQKRLHPSHQLQRLTRGPARVGCSGPRTASTQPVPAAETQRSTCIARATRCHNLHARQSACMLVLRLHLAATARRPASDNVRACQARLVSRINTQPASNRTGAGHDGGCVLASAAENNLMSLAEVGGASSASPRPSESNAVAARLGRAECRAAGATGRRARHSRGGISFVAFVAAKVRKRDSSFSKIVDRLTFDWRRAEKK